MKLKFIIILVSVFTLFETELHSQSIGSGDPATSINQFSTSEWENIQKRWEKFQPIVDLITKSGDTISGQVMFANQKEIVVYQGSEILLDNDQMNKIVHINVEEIQSILIQKGGYGAKGIIIGGLTVGGAGFVGGIFLGQGWTIIPAVVLGTVGIAGGGWIGSKVQKASRSSQIELDPNTPEYTAKLERIRRSAIYSDSLFFPEDLYQAVEASRPLARAFPDKHLRISAALSAGPNTIRNDLTKMLESTSLPAITEYRPSPFAIEFFDISWRFSDRYIVGAQIQLNLDGYAYIYSYGDNAPSYTYFNYAINAFEGRYYFDYVLNPVNRFFTKPYEFLVGAGLITGVRSTDFSYAYVPDAVTGNIESLEFSKTVNIYGLQLRSAAHFYPFPGFSLFAGMEANLYNKITVPGYVLPTNNSLIDIEVPEHSMQFSSLRIKVGASIYF